MNELNIIEELIEFGVKQDDIDYLVKYYF